MNTRPPRRLPSSPRRNGQASSPSTKKRRADSIDEDYYAQEPQTAHEMMAEIRTDVRCLQEKLNNLSTYFNDDAVVLLDELFPV